MDTATQALLGAAVGKIGFSPQLGRRAAVWGAVAGLIPDLDVVAVLTHGPFGELLYHRGPTHALWFGPVVGPGLGWLVWRLYRKRPGEEDRLSAWIGLFVLALFTHPLLDLFTVYGTQLLAPFDNTRFAWNGIGIIDPFYSGVLLLGLLLPWGRRAVAVGLAVSTAYLFLGVGLNYQAEQTIRRVLREEGVLAREVRVYPTLLQPFLRRVVARSDGEIRVGLYTPFRPGEPAWQAFEPIEHPFVQKLTDTWEGSVFVWFAMGEINPKVYESSTEVVVELEDLRYGLPGHPRDGLWGIRGIFDRAGNLRGPVVRYSRQRFSRAPSLRGFWRAIWGDFSALPGPPPR